MYVLFGYWFEREGRYFSIPDTQKYFDQNEIETLLIPLYRKV